MGAVLPASATEAVMRSLPEGTDVFRMPRYTQVSVMDRLAWLHGINLSLFWLIAEFALVCYAISRHEAARHVVL